MGVVIVVGAVRVKSRIAKEYLPIFFVNRSKLSMKVDFCPNNLDCYDQFQEVML